LEGQKEEFNDLFGEHFADQELGITIGKGKSRLEELKKKLKTHKDLSEVKNAAVSVVVTDKLVVVAFSGADNSKGLVMYFDHKQKRKIAIFLGDNAHIGDREIVLHEDAAINNQIKIDIKKKQETIKDDNFTEFQNRIEDELRRFFGKINSSSD
jgi:phage gp45-like